MSTAVQTPIHESDSILKPALVLMTGRALAFAGTFFIPVVLARVFDPPLFGTYKQIFLIESTLYFIAQFGMASSLYYFLPQAPQNAGRHVANAFLFLVIAGLGGFVLLVAAAPYLAGWLSNAELTPYLPWLGLYLLLRLLSSGLEIVLVARGRYRWASASYAISDLGRAAVFIVPVLLFHNLGALLAGAIFLAAVRAAVTLWYFTREFLDSFRLDIDLLKSQLAYAIPFGLAVLVEILQTTLPQYVVSHVTDPATFAIFAVGCLQIPLVDFAASPTSDVMMVKMQERLAEGRRDAVLAIWHDTTWKLSLLFFPLVACLVVCAHDIILLLFTARYAASIPIFIAWTALILLVTLQVDGVLRVLAQTRTILVLNLVRLAILAALIQLSLAKFFLLGPVLVMLLATVTFKAAGLVRIKTILDIRLGELLPWRGLAVLSAVSAAAALLAFFVRSQLHTPLFVSLLVTGLVYGVAYLFLVWQFNLLGVEEKQYIAQWCRQKSLVVTQVFDLRKA